jgi:hypothetical protein
MSDNDDNDKKTGLKKIDKYIKEQNAILNKLNNILGISSINNKFFMCDIDESVQKEIEAMYEDVKKFYKCGTTRICRRGVTRKFLAIIKIIYKAANIKLIHAQYNVERHDKKINTVVYIVDGVDSA